MVPLDPGFSRHWGLSNHTICQARNTLGMTDHAKTLAPVTRGSVSVKVFPKSGQLAAWLEPSARP